MQGVFDSYREYQEVVEPKQTGYFNFHVFNVLEASGEGHRANWFLAVPVPILITGGLAYGLACSLGHDYAALSWAFAAMTTASLPLSFAWIGLTCVHIVQNEQVGAAVPIVDPKPDPEMASPEGDGFIPYHSQGVNLAGVILPEGYLVPYGPNMDLYRLRVTREQLHYLAEMIRRGKRNLVVNGPQGLFSRGHILWLRRELVRAGWANLTTGNEVILTVDAGAAIERADRSTPL